MDCQYSVKNLLKHYEQKEQVDDSTDNDLLNDDVTKNNPKVELGNSHESTVKPPKICASEDIEGSYAIDFQIKTAPDLSAFAKDIMPFEMKNEMVPDRKDTYKALRALMRKKANS